MAKQIKNRREDLYINEVPPEIPADIVTKTDYPSGSTSAGVVKVSANYGTAVGSGGAVEGVLMGALRTLSQYNTANNALIVSKGTLENVILSVVQTKIAADMGTVYEDAEVGATWTVVLRKTVDGLVFDYAPTT